jgi:hypothetical protein
MRNRRVAAFLFVAVALVWRLSLPLPAAPAAGQDQQSAAAVPFPNKDGSLKFGVLGDFGTGSREQYQLGEQMAKLHERFPYEIVVTVGDNLYGSQRPQDFVNKFETPYKALLDANVKFYASLGNHDDRAQARYKLFNMDGRRYYTFKAPKEDVRFFALESDYPVPEQIKWLEKELQDSNEKWKIPYFHHPLYSSGERHGSDVTLRKALEPLFIKYGVSVVLAGHDHFYERLKPQNGIVYFVVGSGGQLRKGNIDTRTGLTAKGFDTDLAFMAAEISGDEMYFNTISRQGTVIDSGMIPRRTAN